MRHNRSYNKLNRTASHRRALLRNLTTSLLIHGRVETTLAKAKELRPVAEKLITLGRSDTVAARRQAYSYLERKDVVHRLFTDIGPGFKSRPGGYTRIVRTRSRVGDAASLAYISLVEAESKEKKETKKKPAARKPRAKKSEEKAAAAAE